MKDSENRRTVLKTVGAFGVGVGVSSVVGGQIEEFAGVSVSALTDDTREVALPTGEQMQVAQLTESAARTAAQKTVDRDAVGRLAGVEAVSWTDVVGAAVSVDDTAGLMLAAPLADEAGMVAWAAFPGLNELDESVAESLPEDVEFGLDAGTLIAQSTGQSYCETRHSGAHEDPDRRVVYNRDAHETYMKTVYGAAISTAVVEGTFSGPGFVAGASLGYLKGALGGMVGGLITTDWCRVEDRDGSGGGGGDGGGGGGGGGGGDDDGGQDRPGSSRSVQSPATGAGWL